jgi:hypothetical protein
VKETKTENLLAGLTNEVPDGKTFLPVMTDGNETQEMLLALLNNVLVSLIDSQQAKILGKYRTKAGRRATMICFYDVTPNGKLLALSTPNKCVQPTIESGRVLPAKR